MDYGFAFDLPCVGAMPARVIAVHRERYQLFSEHGFAYGRLKAGIYFANISADYPAVGDFVLLH